MEEEKLKNIKENQKIMEELQKQRELMMMFILQKRFFFQAYIYFILNYFLLLLFFGVNLINIKLIKINSI